MSLQLLVQWRRRLCNIMRTGVGKEDRKEVEDKESCGT